MHWFTSLQKTHSVRTVHLLDLLKQTGAIMGNKLKLLGSSCYQVVLCPACNGVNYWPRIVKHTLVSSVPWDQVRLDQFVSLNWSRQGNLWLDKWVWIGVCGILLQKQVDWLSCRPRSPAWALTRYWSLTSLLMLIQSSTLFQDVIPCHTAFACYVIYVDCAFRENERDGRQADTL